MDDPTVSSHDSYERSLFGSQSLESGLEETLNILISSNIDTLSVCVFVCLSACLSVKSIFFCPVTVSNPLGTPDKLSLELPALFPPYSLSVSF